ncbi:hypothetical protein [Clostridium sp. DL-VIII]|uniref:hypothetical protein n=1 Tax=Clostridium sp. DL-VIII TaxID=641107 RepID=UPI001FA80D1B|nr:hypothetical protein [Clostridium sp. DL-VIII]
MTKTTLIGLITATTILSGCTNTKEIKISENVKNDILAKTEDNKIRSEPALQKKLEGLDNKIILFWIDDENILIINSDAFSMEDKNIILSSYNLESEESTELLNDSSITRVYGFDESGVVLLGSDNKAFIYDAKEEKLKEVLDFSKEFEDKISDMESLKNKEDVLSQTHLKLINRDYISYANKVNYKPSNDIKETEGTAEYTILNYNENKKYTIESSFYGGGLNCKTDLTGKNIFIQELGQITKLNLETGEKSSMKLSEPKIEKVFEDGTLLVECVEKNKSGNVSERWYKLDFDNKDITKYDVNFESKNLSIDAVDLKNEFVVFTYLGEGKERNKNIAMYGKLEGNKIVIKDKIFKNKEDNGCNTARHFIFSPDHNKFITGVEINKQQDDSSNSEINKIDSEYLFELY